MRRVRPPQTEGCAYRMAVREQDHTKEHGARTPGRGQGKTETHAERETDGQTKESGAQREGMSRGLRGGIGRGLEQLGCRKAQGDDPDQRRPRTNWAGVARSWRSWKGKLSQISRPSASEHSG